MQRLRQANRIAEQRHLAATGQAAPRPRRQPLTKEEQEALDAQGRYRSSDLPVEQQQQLKGELVSMWAQIPKHLMPKLAEWERRERW
jgi:hypothetical protein